MLQTYRLIYPSTFLTMILKNSYILSFSKYLQNDNILDTEKNCSLVDLRLAFVMKDITFFLARKKKKSFQMGQIYFACKY